MKCFFKDGELDWLIIIPCLFWLFCLGISVGKILQTGNEIHIIDWLDIINSNTISTYISMIICMAYQFFCVKNKNQEEESGLSRKYISLTLVSSVLYGIVAIINACRFNIYTTVLMTVVSAIYVFLFFKYMKRR